MRHTWTQINDFHDNFFKVINCTMVARPVTWHQATETYSSFFRFCSSKISEVLILSQQLQFLWFFFFIYLPFCLFYTFMFIHSTFIILHFTQFLRGSTFGDQSDLHLRWPVLCLLRLWMETFIYLFYFL